MSAMTTRWHGTFRIFLGCRQVGRYLSVMSIRLALTVLVLSLTVAATASAEATVHLQDGGRVRGDLIEVVPKQKVTIRLPDGELRFFDWKEIERIVEHPDPSTRSERPDTQQPARGDAQLERRRQRLHQEIEALRVERESVSRTGPAVLLTAGYITGPAIFVGVPLLLVEDYGVGSDYRTAAIALTVVGAAGITAGIIGYVWTLENAETRFQIGEKMKRKRRELRELRVGVGPALGGAQLALSGRF